MVKSFAYDGNMGMYYAVSELGDPSEERKKKSPKDNFRKPLRRIGLEGQIPLIFDNPAELIIKSSSKSSKKIINDILAGINETSKVHSISDRKKAIKFALEEMESREGKNIMLLAGKGHENYQLIGPDKNYFDDKKTVISLLKK